MPKRRDTIYSDNTDLVDFAFDAKVARVFDDMIRRSVPGYETLVSLLGVLAERFVQPGTVCYDLGCSLGAATLAMDRRLGGRDCRIIAVDNAEPMLQRCRANLDALASGRIIDLVCADIRDIRVRDASLVVLNYTLQFIPPAQRLDILRRIAAGLLPGGALVLSEKVCFDRDGQQALFTDLHYGFKRANGYSELEISRKRTALENVLVPDTITTHRERLFEAGFSRVEQWFQCLNFVSFLAVK